MDNELPDLIKSCKLFSTLDISALQKIASKASIVELRPNDVLFYQGTPSDSIFLLTQGEMIATFTTTDNETKVMGHIVPNETVGELSALSGEPRSLTIKATKDCILLKLSSKDFVETCYLYPAVMYATVHPVITHSQHLLQIMSLEKTHQQIVLVPANHKIGLLERFAETFIYHANHFQNLIVISDFQQEFNDNNLDPDLLKQKIYEHEKNQKKLQKIIYLLKSPTSSLAKICLKKADMLYLIADSESKPKIDSHINIDHSLLSRIDSRTAHFNAYPELILLHSEETPAPRNTQAWLQQTTFHLHHHIRIHVKHDYDRLLRFIRGKAVGVVLGGGGTRGWAHLGAIKALIEEKIPIDIIGGTSVGAIVGACYALHQSYDDAYEKFHSIIETSRHSISWRSLTWPVISLFDAKNFTNSQMNAFQELLIEDMWLPFFCISSNLANYTECIHRNGFIWEKIRASSSIPGLIPPMVIDGELHLDGGLLNNLPVDVMRQFIGKNGKVIAVELNNSMGDRRHYQFPPIFTFKEALKARIMIKKNATHYRLPRFIDTFMRGLLVGSSAKARQNSLAANVLVNPYLNKFRLLHSSKKQADKIIEIGYVEMKKQLEKSKDKN